MAGLFEKGFNKFADFGNELNKGANKVIGKEVFGEIKKMEGPREFPPYSSFEEYTEPEPEQWIAMKGKEREFSFCGRTLKYSDKLDMIMQYKKLFEQSAKYYTERFKFKYNLCVTDFDSFLNYFKEMYFEGLEPMIDKAHSLCLPLGIFNAKKDDVINLHVKNFRRAFASYEALTGLVESNEEFANNLGDTVGNSIQMQGGGFGFKGAMKGMAKAEGFNLEMGLVGKYVANQTKMSQEDKAAIFVKFNTELFFEEVYSDYVNTYMTILHYLAIQKVFGNISIGTNDEFNNMVENLKNPMFPEEKVTSFLFMLLSKFPFAEACYEVAEQRCGESEELNQIKEYFLA